MSTKVKGLLKGLRYISQIFEDGDEKETEMQIGFPTDVKHVAHIGWDGTSVSSPSWMNEFKSSLEPVNTVAEAQENSISKTKKEKPKTSKHHQSMNSSSSPINSPTRRSKHNRSLMDSPTKGSPGRSTSRHSKKNQNSGLGNVAASQDQTASPKKSRRRKSKGSKEADTDSGFALDSGHG